MAYDGMYGELSTRGTANDILNQVLQAKDDVSQMQDEIEVTSGQALDAAAQSATSAAMSLASRNESAGFASVSEDFSISAASAANDSSLSAAAASNSASEAATAETGALASSTKAQQWATNPEDSPVEPGLYSSLHWAKKSEEAASSIIIANERLNSIAGATTAVNDILIADTATTMAPLGTGAAGRQLLGSATPTDAKTYLSLQNVDNTSDINKPVSTATQSAINTSAATLQGNIDSVNTTLQGEIDALETLVNDNASQIFADIADLQTNKQDAATAVTRTPAITGAVLTPGGTDAQRPSSPSEGMFRYNSDSESFEGYQGGGWHPVGGGRFFGELVMLPNRQSSPNGVIKADGQLITNATATYPDVVADLQSGTPSVPVVTPAAWLSDPLNRASWAYDSVNDEIRVPDWNGIQAGSIGPLMFRGDGTLGFAPGKARMDQIQNITGSWALGTATGHVANGQPAPTGAFKLGVLRANSFGTQAAQSYTVEFDASGSARTGTETFGKHGVGVWGVVLFGAVSNPGAADAAALATSYANQQSELTLHEGRLDVLDNLRPVLTATINGADATPSVVGQKGTGTVISVSRTATGRYLLTFSGAITDDTNKLCVLVSNQISTLAYIGLFDRSASTTSSITIATLLRSDGTSANLNGVGVVVYAVP